jgi:type II secretion system protein I
LTLLEVLLAMAIFLISLAAISTLIDTGTTSAVDAAGTTTAARLARSKLAEVEAGVIPVADGGSGTFEGDDANWNWEVTPTPVGSPNTYEVTVKVSRGQGRRLEVTVTQVIYDPALMNNAATATPPETATTTGGSNP